VSSIHSELKESEKELLVLEKELQEIDQIERDLSTLTHERDLILSGIRDAAGKLCLTLTRNCHNLTRISP
jgi:t-SNARE complex subunit (syntaxin)